jgi:hypothetical protein
MSFHGGIRNANRHTNARLLVKFCEHYFGQSPWNELRILQKSEKKNTLGVVLFNIRRSGLMCGIDDSRKPWFLISETTAVKIGIHAGATVETKTFFDRPSKRDVAFSLP